MKFSYFRLMILIVLSLMLTMVALPEQISIFRPFWVLLLMLYIQFMLPNAFHLSGVILFGLTLDVMGGSPLGQHLFAMTCVAWCASTRARRFKFFSMPQQIIWILVLCLMYQVIVCLLDYILGYPASFWSVIPPVCMSTLAWPLIRHGIERFLLGKKRQRRLSM
jgi:rod shape-determining protein MreD